MGWGVGWLVGLADGLGLGAREGHGLGARVTGTDDGLIVSTTGSVPLSSLSYVARNPGAPMEMSDTNTTMMPLLAIIGSGTTEPVNAPKSLAVLVLTHSNALSGGRGLVPSTS